MNTDIETLYKMMQELQERIDRLEARHAPPVIVSEEQAQQLERAIRIANESPVVSGRIQTFMKHCPNGIRFKLHWLSQALRLDPKTIRHRLKIQYNLVSELGWYEVRK